MPDGNEKNLDEMTVTELRERAAELEITGRSSMSKEDLLQSVKDAEEQTAYLQADRPGSHASGESEDGEDAANEWLPRMDNSAADAGTSSSAVETDSDSESESDSGAGDAPNSDSEGGEEDASDITAPSIGPNTTIEHVPPDERLDMDKISDVDAMGLDKRRQVGGQRYGASPAKQAAVYGGAIAIIVALVFGAKLLADELDQPPAVQEDKAPWADAEQKEPAPIDFPRSTEQ